MENQEINIKKKSNERLLKTIILILLLLLCASGYYSYRLGINTKIAQEKELKLIEQKASLLANLEKQKSDYDIAINDKSAISAELEMERAKVIQLISQVKRAKSDLNVLTSYKKKYIVLELKMKELMIQNEELKKKNITLTTERDSTITVLDETKKYNDDLKNENSELTNTVLKASRLSMIGLKASTFKLKNSGKQIDTDKASSVNLIKISYSIAKNPVAKKMERFYYIRVTDLANNVLGNKQTQTFASKVLTYSIKSRVNYVGESVNVLEEFVTKDLVKGTYSVNVFDRNELIAETSFTLR